MDGKKLNENDFGSILENNEKGNSCELLENTLSTRRKINGLTNLIQLKDNHIKDLEDKLSEIEIKLSVHEKNKDKDDLIATLSLESTSMKEKLDNVVQMLSTLNEKIQNEAKIKDKDDQIAMLQSKINSNEIELDEYKSQIKKHESFIKKQTEWIQIQKRTDGNGSNFRSFQEYIDGFSDQPPDFWLGLEKIHILTSREQYELYIHLIDYEDKTHFARYDNFVVGSKDEQYKLKLLDSFQGDVWDIMRNTSLGFIPDYSEYRYGWWYLEKQVGKCDYDGNYIQSSEHRHNIFWDCSRRATKCNGIKSIEMFIKPKTKKFGIFR